MVLACSTVADTLNWSKFNATPVYADTMVCAHHRSVVLNNGLRMAQFPASMLLVSQAMQSQPCGGSATTVGKETATLAARTNRGLATGIISSDGDRRGGPRCT